MYFFYLVILAFIGWAAYKQGFNNGWRAGYGNGQKDGLKQGKDEGLKAGLKAGIKEHMISTLADTPEVPGIHKELHLQAREEILKVLNTPPPKKPDPPPKVGLLRSIWQQYDGILVLIGFVLLLVYLFR